VPVASVEPVFTFVVSVLASGCSDAALFGSVLFVDPLADSGSGASTGSFGVLVMSCSFQALTASTVKLGIVYAQSVCGPECFELV